jgi:hypothetical protein
MKMRTLSLLLASGLLAGFGLLPLAAQTTETQPPATTAPNESAPPRAKPDVAKAKKILEVMAFSPGVVEVIKLGEAGVEESVILQFIQNSPVAYHPSAQDIIRLREANISSPVISALLQHGGELRQRAAENAARTPAPAPAPVAAQSPPEPIAVQPAVCYPAPAAYAVASPPVIYSSYPAYNYGYRGCYSPYTIYSGAGFYGYGGFSPSISLGFRFGGGYGGYYGGRGYYGGHGGYGGGYHGGYRGSR